MAYTLKGEKVEIHLPKAGDVILAKDDFEGPAFTVMKCLADMQHDEGEVFRLPGLLGVDTSGWRAGDLAGFVFGFVAALDDLSEMTLPEESGSETSSEPTAKKSKSSASARA